MGGGFNDHINKLSYILVLRPKARKIPETMVGRILRLMFLGSVRPWDPFNMGAHSTNPTGIQHGPITRAHRRKTLRLHQSAESIQPLYGPISPSKEDFKNFVEGH